MEWIFVGFFAGIAGYYKKTPIETRRHTESMMHKFDKVMCGLMADFG